MSAGAMVATAVVASLADVGLAGVYDGPPARAAYPYATIDAASEADWSHKTGTGREVALAVTVWDDQPMRLRDLADAAEQRIAAIELSGDWQLVSLRFVRRRVIRDVSGPWAAAIDFRARLLAN
ncbi:DUF3168 domain-containing protein [Sphingomonas sp.]|uniref:tail completion protein gp17 n=1 Tax=Sphingomonas sp. TaxID=28214 RepID=UPI0025E6916A|nr:DUF3168 domain-containing protein [Sphingomonas sp.]MBV9529251.1 DUF3168 domain-containing protein [Sphingomonas sp.]